MAPILGLFKGLLSVAAPLLPIVGALVVAGLVVLAVLVLRGSRTRRDNLRRYRP